MKSSNPNAKTNARSKPAVLVAIVGGSGSGKSWLASKLASALGNQAARISLDDFYRDRSHLSPNRRALINFDHPRSLDWGIFASVLIQLARGKGARAPRYDFDTHCRRAQARLIEPKPFLIVDGLWLLRRPGVRKLFNYSIFLDCGAPVRLERRLERDLQTRGRTEASIRRQFRDTVEPMHRRYVAPQARFATVVLHGEYGDREVSEIIPELRKASR